jgi:hypothetical protein
VDSLPAPALRAVRAQLASAATVIGWAGAVYATGLLVAFADGDGWGASLTREIAQTLAMLVGVVAAALGGEALLGARCAA